MAHLWTFLEHEGVSPTNNHAERMIRFGVLWRKCSQGTSSDKGNRWVERILTLRQTCRLRSLKTYPILVDAVRCYFKEQKTDLLSMGMKSVPFMGMKGVPPPILDG
jgi:transposase